MDANSVQAVVNKLQLEQLARARFTSEESNAQLRRSRYDDYHDLFAPQRGDQWPTDRMERPNKLHITANMCRAFVDTEARLLSILPRMTMSPDDSRNPDARKNAEIKEKVFMRWLEQSGWEQWMFTLNQVKGVYGLSFLKPFWNDKTGAPDVYVIEQPQNLLIGWGDSDYTTIDWAIYRSFISPLQAKLHYPDAPQDWYDYGRGEQTWRNSGSDHSDPLEQGMIGSRKGRSPGYQDKNVEIWDYWYVAPSGVVTNCIMMNGHLVDGPFEHPEYPVVPYIPIEHDHEPGWPEGRGTVELLQDIQMGLNRVMSHLAQLVWDDSDPAYQLTGEQAPSSVPEGIVPKGGELVAPGAGTKIERIERGVNNFPLDDLINQYWQAAFKITGLPEILFGGMPGAQTSGRAVAVQIEAAANRLDPKRKFLYEGLRQLMHFWDFMVDKKNPTVKAGDKTIRLKDVFKGLKRWVIIAPEITPRNVVEHTMNTINQLNAKTISLETAMDELGVENPIEEMERVMQERSNAHLFPGDAQAIAAVIATLQQIQAQQQAQQAAAGAQATANNGTAAGGKMNQDQANAQPTGPNDMNQPGPMSQQGGPPTPGGSQIGGQLQPLVRQTAGGDSQAMSQIVLPRTTF